MSSCPGESDPFCRFAANDNIIADRGAVHNGAAAFRMPALTLALAQKTRRAFFLVLFTPLLLGLVVALEVHAYQRSVDWVAHTQLVLSTTRNFLLAVTRAESAQRGYLITRNEFYSGQCSQSEKDAFSQIVNLSKLTSDNPAQQKNINELRAAVDLKFGMMNDLIQRRRIGLLSLSQQTGLLTKGTSVMDQIWTVGRRTSDHESQLLRSRTKTERETEIGVGASFVVCILVNLGVLIWAYRIITTYAREKEVAAEHIRGLNADLEQRIAERTAELESANLNLIRSNEDLTNFAYVASHDLQEPLRTIGSYVGLLGLRYQGKLDEQADKYIQFAVDGAKRMQVLVQDLLVYSRVGTEPIKPAPVKMETVLKNVCESLALLIQEQQVSIVSDPLPNLIGDEGKLTRVFLNLISNAIKFRKDDEAPRIVVSACATGDIWRFSISDNGIGFDEQYAQRIFLIFQRLHGVGVYPGTGMGLAICKRIVEQHGGKIWAKSSPNAGSVFWFTLPRDVQRKSTGEVSSEAEDIIRAGTVLR